MTAGRAAGLLSTLVAAAIWCRAAAGLPDWAKAVAEAAPPVPEGVPEWPERTLLAQTTITLDPDGVNWHITRRQVVQVLSARTEPTSFGFFAFDDTTKIKKSKGWHLPPGERARRNYGGALDLTLPTEFLTDAKTRVVALEDVVKGSLVAYEFQADSRPYTLTSVEQFFDDSPITLARWSIELPPGWTLKSTWLPGDGPEPVLSGTTWTFELRDLVPEREEAMGEAPVHLAPRLVVALQPPPGVAPKTPAFADWEGVARWYDELAKGREAASSDIDAAIKSALTSVRPAPLDRIRAISILVRDRVRYLAREVGIGGYQPHKASQVFSELYGDCKDKGTLLRAALQTAGFNAYPVLIHASNPYTVAPAVPSPASFDHFIVAVVWPAGVAFPEEAASARVDAGDLGTLLVVDPTDERAWPGTLPYNLAGKTAFVIAGSRGVLLTLPEGRPAWNRIDRSATVTFAQDRSVDVRLVSRLYGAPAESARSENAVSFKSRRERIEDGMRSAWPGAQVKDYDVTAEDNDGAYLERLSIVLPPTASALQDNVYWMFAGATMDIDRVPLGKRKSAVQYPYPFEVSYEAVVNGVAKDQALPNPQKLSGAAWTVEALFRRDGAAIHGSWKAELTGTRFEPAAFPDLKQFWSAASKAAGAGIRLAP